MKYPVLLFDFDGTLYDTSRSIARIVNRVRTAMSLPALDTGFILDSVGQGIEKLVRQCFAEAQNDRARVLDLYREMYIKDEAEETVPEPGLMEFLKTDPRTKVVVSNKSEELILRVLDLKDTRGCFHAIIGGDTFPFRKPDARLLPEILRLTNASREDLLMIGDDTPDIEFAANAGLDFVYCGFGFRGLLHQQGRTTINSYEHLSRLLA